MSQRISKITGLPVRAYVRKNVEQAQPVIPVVPSNVIKYSDMIPINFGTFQQHHKINMGGNDVFLHSYPTANCQLGSICPFRPLLKHSTDLIGQLKELRLIKRLWLIDINRGYLSKTLNIIPAKAIVMQNNYTSSNGSEMTIMIINVSKL